MFFPTEIWIEIFTFLPLLQRRSFQLTCRLFRRVALKSTSYVTLVDTFYKTVWLREDCEWAVNLAIRYRDCNLIAKIMKEHPYFDTFIACKVIRMEFIEAITYVMQKSKHLDLSHILAVAITIHSFECWRAIDNKIDIVKHPKHVWWVKDVKLRDRLLGYHNIPHLSTPIPLCKNGEIDQLAVDSLWAQDVNRLFLDSTLPYVSKEVFSKYLWKWTPGAIERRVVRDLSILGRSDLLGVVRAQSNLDHILFPKIDCIRDFVLSDYIRILGESKGNDMSCIFLHLIDDWSKKSMDLLLLYHYIEWTELESFIGYNSAFLLQSENPSIIFLLLAHHPLTHCFETTLKKWKMKTLTNLAREKNYLKYRDTSLPPPTPIHPIFKKLYDMTEKS